MLKTYRERKRLAYNDKRGPGNVCLTHGFVLNTVDLGVYVFRSHLTISGQVVLNFSNLQNTSLFESPASQLLSKLSVNGRNLLSVGSLDRAREPLVLEGFHRAQNNEAGRVESLNGRDHIQLRAGGFNVVGRRHLLLGVVRVSGGRSSQDGRNQLAVATQNLGGDMRESENTLAIEEGLDIGTQGTGALEQEDVVLLSGRDCVVIEVVNDNSGAVVRKVDIDFEEEGADGARGRGLAGEGEDDVAILVHEVQDVLRGQVGAKS